MAWLARWTTTLARLAVVIVAWFGAVLACAVVCGELLRLAERPDGSTPFDSSITSWAVAHRTPAWTALARGLSTLGSQAVLTPLVAAAAVALIARRRWGPAGLLVTAWGGAILLYTVTKDVVARPRPPSGIWLTNVGKTTSFPSGHATQSLATFLALGLVASVWLSKPAWSGRVLALALAGAVGWSRVYLGVHWSSDVLAGWTIAALWATAILSLTAMVARLEPRRRDSPVDQTQLPQ